MLLPIIRELMRENSAFNIQDRKSIFLILEIQKEMILQMIVIGYKPVSPRAFSFKNLSPLKKKERTSCFPGLLGTNETWFEKLIILGLVGFLERKKGGRVRGRVLFLDKTSGYLPSQILINPYNFPR